MKKVLHNKKKKHLVQDREQLLVNNASLEMLSTIRDAFQPET